MALNGNAYRLKLRNFVDRANVNYGRENDNRLLKKMPHLRPLFALTKYATHQYGMIRQANGWEMGIFAVSFLLLAGIPDEAEKVLEKVLRNRGVSLRNAIGDNAYDMLTKGVISAVGLPNISGSFQFSVPPEIKLLGFIGANAGGSDEYIPFDAKVMPISLATQAVKGVGRAAEGDTAGLVKLLPKALQDVATAVDEWDGLKSGNGKALVDVDGDPIKLDTADNVFRMFGFNSNDRASIQARRNEYRLMVKEFRDTSASLKSERRKAIESGDTEEAAAIEKEIEAFNVTLNVLKGSYPDIRIRPLVEYREEDIEDEQEVVR
jgi:hypothetical protein